MIHCLHCYVYIAKKEKKHLESICFQFTPYIFDFDETNLCFCDQFISMSLGSNYSKSKNLNFKSFKNYLSI